MQLLHQFYKVSGFFSLTKTRSACATALDFRYWLFDSLLESRRYRIGGAKRDRTADPLRARQVLSQLSYSPSVRLSPLAYCHVCHDGKVVGLGGLEPPTSPLSGVRSNQLSYRP